MGIAAGRFTMSSPTGVSNTHTSAHVFVTAILGQIVHLTFGLVNIQRLLSVNKGHTSGVVTTILQSTKSFYQNRKSVFFSYISYYSTHIIYLNILVSMSFSAAKLIKNWLSCIWIANFFINRT